MQTVWHLPPISELLFRDYDMEVLVFDAGSGNTHIVDPIAGCILRHLSKHPQNSQLLAQEVSTQFQLPADTSLASYIDSLLHSLAQQNLLQKSTA